MKTILVAIDFSKSSKNALNYAAKLAELTKSKLVLFHVYNMPIVTPNLVVMPIWVDIEKDSINALEKQKHRLQLKYGEVLEVECICEMGFSAEDVIKKFINDNQIDLVIMGMRGASYLGEKLIGSTTTSFINKSDCPVLVINEKVRFKSLKRIVLAFDYEKSLTKSALSRLIEFVNIFNSEVYILHIVNNTQDMPTLKNAAAGVETEKILDGINHSYHYIENEDTINGINEFVTSKKANLIVTIPRKHNFFHTILHESNTKKLAFHTSIPLLALHE